MPESAEVRRLGNEIRGVVGHVIESTQVLSGRYTKKPIAGFNKLAGYKFAYIIIKGKLIAFGFEPPTGIGVKVVGLSTLGMTGWWYVIERAPSHHTAPDHNFKHARLRINFETTSLIFVDPRNFGTFKVTTTGGFKKKMEELGPDIAGRDLMLPEFWPRFERYAKKKSIAEVMLDQRLFCGVGNYMRADALYLARIDPRTPAHDLTRQQLGQLWAEAHRISNCAFENRHPISPVRVFRNVCYGLERDHMDNPIQSYEDSNGRTVWWCPNVQKRV